MSINHIVTRGYGNGTLVGDISLVPVRGYTPADNSVTMVLDNLSLSLTMSNLTYVQGCILFLQNLSIVKVMGAITIPGASVIGNVIQASRRIRPPKGGQVDSSIQD